MVLPHWTVLKVIPYTGKDAVFDAFFTSRNAVDNNFMKNLDVIVDSGTNSDHHLVTAVVMKLTLLNYALTNKLQ